MRLIDADIANRWMERNNSFIDSHILKAIPTIDPLDVLGICRCKECIFFKYNDVNEPYCISIHGLPTPKETDYCSFGKRKGNSNETN